MIIFISTASRLFLRRYYIIFKLQHKLFITFTQCIWVNYIVRSFLYLSPKRTARSPWISNENEQAIKRRSRNVFCQFSVRNTKPRSIWNFRNRWVGQVYVHHPKCNVQKSQQRSSLVFILSDSCQGGTSSVQSLSFSMGQSGGFRQQKPAPTRTLYQPPPSTVTSLTARENINLS